MDAVSGVDDGGAASAAVRRYQQGCFERYAADVGLPSPYTYPDGNPIRPLPPVQTAVGGVMIVGAYPSARFEARPSTRSPRRRRLVPVADNLHPFAEEEYFDGQRVRRLVPGDGLRRYVLRPLGLSPSDCWVTDLVKVFLYKADHADSCGDACPHFRVPVLRDRYADLATESLKWLTAECRLCRPRLVLTLGHEVAQAVSGEPRAKADDLLGRPVVEPASIGGWPTLFLPHPDICRRSPKWERLVGQRLASASSWLTQGDRVTRRRLRRGW